MIAFGEHSDTMFSVNHLSFSYGRHVVLKRLNFKLTAGKFYTILGPNGSGKTTLLKLLNGELRGADGHLDFDGNALHQYPVEQLARRFAVIHQRAAINFPFTCVEIVMMARHPFVRRLRSLSAADMDIVYAAMEQTDTLQFAQAVITEISGGEFQRVMFARALAQQPQVLFLDEAFSGVDIAHHLHALKLLRQLVDRDGATVIAVMHDLNFAYHFSDEALVLKDGELQGQAAPQLLFTEMFIRSVFNVNVRHIEQVGLIVTP